MLPGCNRRCYVLRMAAYAPYTVVSGKSTEELSRQLNHMAQYGYQPMPGGFVDRGAKGVWATLELASEDLAQTSSDAAAEQRLAEAEKEAQRVLEEARAEAENIRQHGPAGVRAPDPAPPARAPIESQGRPKFGTDPLAATATPPPPPPPAIERNPDPKPKGVRLEDVQRGAAGGPEPHG